MRNERPWAGISLFSLCLVACLGFILRSKILFDLPWINYLNLLDAHSHFAFGGWVTLALTFLFVHELLPASFQNRNLYQWLLGSITLNSLALLIVNTFDNDRFLADLFNAGFILSTYVFAWVFIGDLRKTAQSRTVYLLSTCAIAALVLSSAGPIALTYLHAVGARHPFLNRDALYTYLHLQYNGFFTLAVFALLFRRLYPKISRRAQRGLHRFSVLLCASVLPSLFLSFLWQDPNGVYRMIALAGSVLLLLSVTWFVVFSLPHLKSVRILPPLLRYAIFLSMAAFVLKMILQSLTIFTSVGTAVFGDRPMIIGFLHLVFLGFVSPMILVHYVKLDLLNFRITLVRVALTIFLLSIVGNEITLMLQGLGSMLLKGSYLFSWFLWLISIGLMTGAILMLTANRRLQDSASGTIRQTTDP